MIWWQGESQICIPLLICGDGSCRVIDPCKKVSIFNVPTNKDSTEIERACDLNLYGVCESSGWFLLGELLNFLAHKSSHSSGYINSFSANDS